MEITTKIRQKLSSKISPEYKRKIIALASVKGKVEHWLKVKSADVLLISFPKCGRTWLSLMIGKSIELQFGLKNASVLELDQMAIAHADIPKIVVSHDDNPFWKEPHRLSELRTKYKQKKIIFLVRDPRDVLVSSYFQKKHRWKRYDGDLSDYLYEKKGGFEAIIKFYNIWATNRHIPKEFVLVRYEDIHKDPYRELRKVLQFIGIKRFSDEVIADAIEFASFDNMRKMEEEDTYKSGKLRVANSGDKESYKVRKGKIGGFADYLSIYEIEYLNKKMNETLTSFYGYKV